jgi:hypothetical protein
MPAATATTIDQYHAGLAPADRDICLRLRAIIDRHLPDAQSKVWHAHPVWFLEANPIVGYARRKSEVRLLFWSGQSFTTPGLKPEGTFRAAEAHYTDADQIDESRLAAWLAESRAIQWDYRNIVKNRGRLDWLSEPSPQAADQPPRTRP